MKKLDQNGSHLLAIALVVVVLGVVGFAGYKVMGGDKKKNDFKADDSKTSSETARVVWRQTGDGYEPESTPPKCDDQMVKVFPSDITKITSVLYPGQYRGPSYKPHGGFRFDGSTNEEAGFKAPFDGYIIAGVAFIADVPSKDVNYGFDVMNNCGMMFRAGHLLTLSPAMAEVAKQFPAPKENYSLNTVLKTPVKISAGDVMATASGTLNNPGYDWGIYDYNQPNEISKDATWAKGDQHDTANARYALCFFDEMSPEDRAILKALPGADGKNGKTSDYCK